MRKLKAGFTEDNHASVISLGFDDELRAVLQRSSQGLLDEATAAELSQCFEILEFQLGNELSTDTLLQPAPQRSVHSEHNPDNLAKNLYIIGEGRVRLLGFDSAKGREVSVGVLQGGDTFGADAGWGNESLPYQVVAGSSGWMARIDWEQLQPWLERCPQLAAQWRQQAQHRQCLSFMKTLTKLRSQSSLILQQLLIYIEETQIRAGESLADFAATQPGYFWLRGVDTPPVENTGDSSFIQSP
ncbi:MAG: Crp/Fnr family transcriptional regulator [Coleofasciculus sp. G3-WIS-01]|uniref:Crp/Fnr family transcriptional regulator n=1 Tax=Coleofasciculus sp. G3-WIS-01 TaxID=3069528 RepID=UPI0032F59A34